MNYKNFGNELPGSLARQTSIYSLTFDELQSTMGSTGKDFGSMNMDELLKSIWSAEETQTVGSTSGIQQGTGVHAPVGSLQKQGSLTLPRTLSQKTVDEVWRDMSNVNKDVSGFGGFNLQQRQQTLGEMTLEEFLVKAGVVREDNWLAGKPDNTSNNNNSMNGLFGDMLNPVSNNPPFGLGYQQTGNQIPEPNNQFSFQTTNLPIQQPQQQPQQNQQILPKRPYATPMSIPMGITGVQDQGLNGNLGQNIGLQGGGTGRIGGGGGVVTVAAAAASPVISSNGFGNNNGDISSVSPVPNPFSGGLRGRKSSGVEKVVERRQRRMIKNRESAARSRARKQAYTMELEAEIAKLKEENEDLQKKQDEITKMQKNQLLEMSNIQKGAKRRSLRRTQTGMW